MSQRGLFAIALLVSLAAHGAAAWYWSGHSASEGAGEQGNTRLPIEIALTVTQSAPAAPAPQQPPPAVEPRVTPPEEPPAVKPAPPVARARPVAAQTPQPAESTLLVTDTPLQAVTVARAGAGAAQAEPAIDYAGLTESYRSRVLARIESFKHYPMAARRKQLEGSLEVDLSIDCDGSVAALKVDGASGVLRNAAARSVQRAAPLPAPPPELGCPRNVAYLMSYQLR